MTKYIPIAGTWNRDENDKTEASEWWKPDSPFALYMLSKSFQQALVNSDPFRWSANLEGFGIKEYFTRHENWEWRVAGEVLGTYLKSIPFADRNVIAHSHGGQVALFAASEKCPINHLMTVATPVRKDMVPQIEKARPNITYWSHIHSDCSDVWQIGGELFDGQIGFYRDMKKADENISIPRVAHSDILYKPDFFHVWDDYNLFQHLKDKLHVQ